MKLKWPLGYPPTMCHPEGESKKGFSTAPGPLEIDHFCKESEVKFWIESKIRTKLKWPLGYPPTISHPEAGSKKVFSTAPGPLDIDHVGRPMNIHYFSNKWGLTLFFCLFLSEICFLTSKVPSKCSGAWQFSDFRKFGKNSEFQRSIFAFAQCDT